MSKLEKQCEKFRMAVKDELIHKSGLILNYGNGKNNQEVSKQYFIGNKSKPIYIDNCPFCGDKLNVENRQTIVMCTYSGQSESCTEVCPLYNKCWENVEK